MANIEPRPEPPVVLAVVTAPHDVPETREGMKRLQAAHEAGEIVMLGQVVCSVLWHPDLVKKLAEMSGLEETRILFNDRPTTDPVRHVAQHLQAIGRGIDVLLVVSSESDPTAAMIDAWLRLTPNNGSVVVAVALLMPGDTYGTLASRLAIDHVPHSSLISGDGRGTYQGKPGIEQAITLILEHAREWHTPPPIPLRLRRVFRPELITSNRVSAR